MGKINLFLMDMSDSRAMSGVDRYVSVLMKGLQRCPDICVHRIRLLLSPSLLMHTEEMTEYGCEVTIPLPQQLTEILKAFFWTRKYNALVFDLIRHLFENKTHIILHLHTLNLIDLALDIKKEFPCRIITHLHCIPWKNLYNSNVQQFNRLYDGVYIKKEEAVLEYLPQHAGEIQAYQLSDRVVCLTQCARTFVEKVSGRKSECIDVIPNGMDDRRGDVAQCSPSKEGFELLYVGMVSESKGIFFVLEALRMVQQMGYEVTLHIVGKAYPREHQRIVDEYSDLSLHMTGCVPFDELREYYLRSDMGIIASLHEQASYVAIEMAMFGLPIVTTGVDGLGETFTDGVDACVVDTVFSRTRGLTVDVPQLAQRIAGLLADPQRRAELGRNARALYEKDLSLQQMINQTVSIYQQTIKIDL